MARSAPAQKELLGDRPERGRSSAGHAAAGDGARDVAGLFPEGAAAKFLYRQGKLVYDLHGITAEEQKIIENL